MENPIRTQNIKFSEAVKPNWIKYLSKIVKSTNSLLTFHNNDNYDKRN